MAIISSMPVSSAIVSLARAVRPGILRRILNAIVESRQLKANREVAEILARRG